MLLQLMVGYDQNKIIHIKGKDIQTDGHTTVKVVDGSVLEKVTQFKYLQSIKSVHGSCLQHIKTRVSFVYLD